MLVATAGNERGALEVPRAAGGAAHLWSRALGVATIWSTGHNVLMRKLHPRILQAVVLGLLLVLFAVLLAAYGLAWAAAAAGIGAFFVESIALMVKLIPRGGRSTCLSTEDEATAFADFIRGQRASSDDRLKPLSSRDQLPVRWGVTARAREMMRGLQLGPTRQFAGTFNEIRDVFLKVPEPRRMVFLGDGGAGKTILIAQLAKDMLKPDASNGEMRVPFYLAAADWDTRKDMTNWIADQLINIDNRLELKVPWDAETRVADEWAKRRILPLIDGIDELPGRQRVDAIRKINEVSNIPLIVTCRTGEYETAVKTAGHEISNAVVVELKPLYIGQVKRYLRKTTATVPSDRWNDVFASLKARQNPLRSVLTNPLMLWLASRLYESKEHSPEELANEQRFIDKEAIEDHLLNHLVDAIYSSPSASAPPRWTPKQAKRWLKFLANYMERTHSADLAWWHLPRTVRDLRPLSVAVRVMLLFGVAWLLAASLLHFRQFVVPGALGRRLLPLVSYIQGLVPGYISHQVMSSQVMSTARAVIAFFRSQSIVSLELWIATLAVGVGVFSAAYDSRHRPVLLTVKARLLGSLVGAAISVVLSIAFCALFLFPLGLVVVDKNGHSILGTLLHMESVWVLALLIISWICAAIPGQWIHPVELSRVVSPADALRRDRRATFSAILPKRTIRLILVWLCFGNLIALACATYVLSAFLCRFWLGGLRTESDRFTEARLWLALRRWMPWMVTDFLEDAADRGILRQSGSLYQFRHIRLRQQLAAQYPRLSRRLASHVVRAVRSYKGPLWKPLWDLVRQWSPNSTAPWTQPFWRIRFEEFAKTPASSGRLSWQLSKSQAWAQTIPGIGRPVGDIRNEGPGYMQAVGGTNEGESWVICALPGEKPVLVAKPVWQALRNTARQALRKSRHEGTVNPLMAVGFPVQAITYANATQVGLRGGSWGPGTLVRDDTDSDWQLNFACSLRPINLVLKPWRHGAQLSISATAEVGTSSRLTIDDETYRLLPEKLEDSVLSSAIKNLWERRKATTPEVHWRYDEIIDQHKRCVNWVVTEMNKKVVVRASADLSIRRYRSLTSIDARAELNIYDIEAWRDSLLTMGANLRGEEGIRLPLRAAADYLGAAWYTVAEILPTLVIDDPMAIMPVYRPSITLDFDARSAHDEALSRRDLSNVIDFSPFVRTDTGKVTHMSVTIEGPLQQSDADRTTVIWEALASMAQHAGFDTPGDRQPPALELGGRKLIDDDEDLKPVAPVVDPSVEDLKPVAPVVDPSVPSRARRRLVRKIYYYDSEDPHIDLYVGTVGLSGLALTVLGAIALMILHFVIGLSWWWIVASLLPILIAIILVGTAGTELDDDDYSHFIRGFDLDESSRTLMFRTQEAIRIVLSPRVYVNNLMDCTVEETDLRRHEWEVAIALREITRLRSELEASRKSSPGPMTTAAVLESKRRDLGRAEDATAFRISVLERYAEQLQIADAAERDLRDALNASGRNDGYLDLIARTAADEYAIAEITGLTEQATAAAEVFRDHLYQANMAAQALVFPTDPQ